MKPLLSTALLAVSAVTALAAPTPPVIINVPGNGNTVPAVIPSEPSTFTSRGIGVRMVSKPQVTLDFYMSELSSSLELTDAEKKEIQAIYVADGVQINNL